MSGPRRRVARPPHDAQAFLRTLDSIGIQPGPVDLREIGGYRKRHADGMIMPRSAAEVALVIDAANRTGTSIYPISTGKNWGFGSRSPVLSGGYVLDLGAMWSIRSLDLEAGIAVIEPGVTQEMLAGALQGSDWMLNVTSAGGETSILGNALENGVGAYRHRLLDLAGAEMISGGGQPLEISADPQADIRLADLPNANFGVVTAGSIRLLRRPEGLAVFTQTIPGRTLPSVLQACGSLMETDVIAGIPKLFNRERGRLQLFAAVHGNVRERKKKLALVRARLGDNLDSTDSHQGKVDEVIQSQVDLFGGIPTNRAVRRYILRPGGDLDLDAHSYLGFRLVSIQVPVEPGLIRRSARLLRSMGREDASLDYTWNLWSPDQLGLVLYIHMARNTAGHAAAAQLQDDIWNAFTELGLAPYRSDIDHMRLFGQCHPEATQRRADLKRKYDPNGIIAPGRGSVH